MAICSKCKKPSTSFPISKKGKPSKMCQHCYEWQKVWNAANQERAKLRKANPPEGMEFCMACKHPKPVADFEINPIQRRKIALGETQARGCAECRAKLAARVKESRVQAHKDPEVKQRYLEERRHYQRQFRIKLIAAYGGHCVCCGETEPKFLELDHINGEGGKHRRQIGSGPEPLYRWAERNGFPPTLQILCGSCHTAKSFWGTCPHQEQRGRATLPSRST